MKPPREVLPLTDKEKEIIRELSETFVICPELITGACKAMHAVPPRWLFWLYLYNQGYNTTQCGSKTGGHDHGTVLHAFDKMQWELSQNRSYRIKHETFITKHKIKPYAEIRSSKHYRYERTLAAHYMHGSV